MISTKKMLLLVGLLSLASFSFALSANMDKGDFSVNAGLSFGWGIGAGGGLEYGIARIDIANTIPLTFGATAKAYFSSYWGYSFLDVGALATCHVSFKDLDLPPGVKPWLDKLDYYIGLGLGVNLLGTNYWTDRSVLSFVSMSGVSYFLNKNLALFCEGGYMTYWSYGLVGVLFKF